MLSIVTGLCGLVGIIGIFVSIPGLIIVGGVASIFENC